MSTAPITTSEWARTNGVAYRWSAALTNHEPCSRDWATGTMFRYGALDEVRGPGIILEDAEGLKDAHRATYLVDDGRTVEVYFVAGWGPLDALNTLFLQPFPTNFDADGVQRVSPKDGRPIDFGTWQLGPRRAYHLKISAYPVGVTPPTSKVEVTS
jgi:hypothetical protein